MQSRRTKWLVATCVLIVALAASAADPAPKKASAAAKASKPDIRFLEYLGTLEDDDENWTDVVSIAQAEPEVDVAPDKPKRKSDTATKSAARPVAKVESSPASAEKK